MKKKLYIVFAVLAGILIVAAAALIIVIAGGKSQDELKIPKYAYRDYIDKSESMAFDVYGGAQLYEAERATIEGGAIIRDNSIASGGKCVEEMETGSIAEFSVDFSDGCDISVTLSLCYVAENNRDTMANNLFSLCLNGVELGTRTVTVPHGMSLYDFRETEFCRLHVEKGKNVFEVISASKNFSVDYLVLTSALPRNSDEKTMGVPVRNFYGADGKQTFECERGVRVDASPIFGDTYSGGFYIRLGGSGAQTAMYIDSDCAATTSAVVAIGGFDEEQELATVLDIYVNGVQITRNAKIPSGGIYEISVGSITLVEGMNELKLVSLGAKFDLDYVKLNSDITYSPSRDVIRYEAERASMYGDCRVIESSAASEGEYVGYVSVQSSVTFNFRSLCESTAYLSLGWSYFGDKSWLDHVISITLNDGNVDLTGIPISQTGGYEMYVELPVGEVAVSDGDNIIIVQCLSENYNLDYITLSHRRVHGDETRTVFEAENAALVGGAQEESSASASNGKNVGFNIGGSSINFAFYSDADMTVTLKLAMSFWGWNNEKMGNVMSLYVNGVAIDISNTDIITTEDWFMYVENTVGEVNLHSGLNTISLRSTVGNYNVDYIVLETA